MKKTLFLVMLITSSSLVFAQGSWWVGGRLGVNFTTVTGKYNSNDDNKHKWITTPLFGGIAMYSFTDLIAVSAELNMAKSGAIYTYTLTNELGQETGEGKYKERYTTLQIPITARFTFGQEWQFFVYGGIYWSKILCGKYKFSSDDYEGEGKIKFGDEPDDSNGEDIYLDKDYNRRMDFGSVVGGGVQRELGPGNIGVDFRFTRGFLDSYKWPENDRPDGYKPYLNMSLSLTVFYLINLN